MYYKRQEFIIETIEELQELCDDWCKRLGMENWDIKLKLVKQKEIEDKMAEVSWNVKKRMAIIKVLRHEEYEDTFWPHDMEASLVHELLHLQFCAFDNFEEGNPLEISLEQSVEQLAVTLVGLKRQALNIRRM